MLQAVSAAARGEHMMRPVRATLFSLCVASLVAHTTQAAEWRTYTATRFGAIADVPRDWAMDPPPDNDDGRLFRSPSRQAQIVIGGSYITDDAASALRDAVSGVGVTYQRIGPDWAVASGVEGSRIFYRRSVIACHNRIMNTVEITYPQSQKQAYDLLVDHVSKSLHSARVSVECR
jgi:serine/threonine-protein kinase